jgi:hypothetical protein
MTSAKGTQLAIAQEMPTAPTKSMAWFDVETKNVRDMRRAYTKDDRVQKVLRGSPLPRRESESFAEDSEGYDGNMERSTARSRALSVVGSLGRGEAREKRGNSVPKTRDRKAKSLWSKRTG